MQTAPRRQQNANSTVDPAAFKSDTLIESAATAYPIQNPYRLRRSGDSVYPY